jgi:hypothetical protein
LVMVVSEVFNLTFRLKRRARTQRHRK